MSATGRGAVRIAGDFYSTPAWAVRAILPFLPVGSALDPCCGEGAILNACNDAWVHCEDVELLGYEIDAGRAARVRGHTVDVRDALGDAGWFKRPLVITNPPFSLAIEFAERSLREQLSYGGTTALLLRLGFMAGQKRAPWHRANPSDVYVLPKRPSFAANGKTDASEYAWFCFGPGRGGRWQVLEVGE